MRKILLFIIGTFFASIVFAQKEQMSFKIEEYKLENGLTVYLNEDHTSPSVLGAVVVKTGGKYDPPFATGTSHYLEHMMFKGTDVIGTINYDEEKVYLDSIIAEYDELAGITDDAYRKEIQKHINELSLKAGQYAIPNELDKILDQIGSTSVNAFTSEEIVAYFNIFPSNQIEKWLFIYSTRFINPVFRLFQSELETVYEEKNMYSDDLISNFIEKFYENFYKNHPYGTQTVLGSANHIKNPSLTNMKNMYDTYYVANNMALILAGNFNSEEIKPIIEKYFGRWKNGEVPEFPEYKEELFSGVEVVKKRITPIKVGVMGYRTVPSKHPDEVALDVCTGLLNNYSSTGYFDKLNLDGKLLAAMCLNDTRNDHGGIMVVYVPKIIGQSMKKTKKIVRDEILKLQTGNIDEDFFEGIKLGLIKEYEISLEKPENRAFVLAQMFSAGKTWDDIMSYPEKIKEISIEDVKRVSAEYLGENYLSFESRMGFPKKDKLEKPGYDPVISKNTEEKSEFAKQLEKIPESDTKPEFIDLQKDLEIINLKNGSRLFYAKNERNDIFYFQLQFNTGILSDPRYSQLAEYMTLIGTQDLDLTEFNEKLQSLGASVFVYASDNYFNIKVEGFDEYFKPTIELISSFLIAPKGDDSKLKILEQTDLFLKRYEKSTPDELANVLTEYGMYGSDSKYLKRLTKKEIKKLRSDEMLELLQLTLTKPLDMHYSGTIPSEQVFECVSKKFDFKTSVSEIPFPVIREMMNYQENTILFLNDPGSLQGKINFYIEGKIITPEERVISKAFNQYFGSGMSSLMFQEIREFRSMAYATYGYYNNGMTLNSPGYFRAFVGTQNDKVIDALFIVDSLISNMPEKENKFPVIKSSMLQSINSNKPDSRNLTFSVKSWLVQGYNDDPRRMQYEVFKDMNFNQIIDFYNENIRSKPVLITIVGNKKQIDMKELSKFGKVIEVEYKQISNK